MNFKTFKLFIFALLATSYLVKGNIGLVYGLGSKALSGDTFELIDANTNKPFKIVKLFGVSSPKEGEPYFEQAKSHLNNMIAGSMVKIHTVETVWAQNDTQYDTEIGLVTCLTFGDIYKAQINEVALQRGFLRHNETESITIDRKLRNSYAESENFAKTKRLGLWAEEAYQELVEDKSMMQGFGAIGQSVEGVKAEDDNDNQQMTILSNGQYDDKLMDQGQPVKEIDRREEADAAMKRWAEMSLEKDESFEEMSEQDL